MAAARPTADGTMLVVVTGIILVADPETFGVADPNAKRKLGCDKEGPIKRLCECAQDIFNELGKTCQRRTHRMNEASFWKLNCLLVSHMKGGRLCEKKRVARRMTRMELSMVLCHHPFA